MSGARPLQASVRWRLREDGAPMAQCWSDLAIHAEADVSWLLRMPAPMAQCWSNLATRPDTKGGSVASDLNSLRPLPIECRSFRSSWSTKTRLHRDLTRESDHRKRSRST